MRFTVVALHKLSQQLSDGFPFGTDIHVPLRIHCNNLLIPGRFLWCHHQIFNLSRTLVYDQTPEKLMTFRRPQKYFVLGAN